MLKITKVTSVKQKITLYVYDNNQDGRLTRNIINNDLLTFNSYRVDIISDNYYYLYFPTRKNSRL